MAPGLLTNASTPEEGFAAGTQSYYSGEGDNSLAGYYQQFQGQGLSVSELLLFDDVTCGT
jgi:hypothetical protein